MIQLTKYLKIRLCLAFSILVFAGAANATEEDPALVVLFGDSITEGCFSISNCATAHVANGAYNYRTPDIKLGQLLNENNRSSVVINFGWGGTPSGTPGNGTSHHGNGLARIDANLAYAKSHYSAHNAAQRYVMIFYGINDESWGIGASTTGFNVGQMAVKGIQQGFTPVVGTIPPRYDHRSGAIVPRNSTIKSNVSGLQGQGYNIYLVDQYQLMVSDYPNLVLPDGLHPNQAGYQRIAENWYNHALKNLIPEAISSAKINITPILSLLLDD